ncbi:hypothetical protein MTO96_041615 [Rhipicephalus appendiculatus]
MEASIEELKGQLRVERERRIELQTPLGEAREREEATGNLVEKTDDDLREKRERWAELEELVKALMALDPVPSGVRGKGPPAEGGFMIIYRTIILYDVLLDHQQT